MESRQLVVVGAGVSGTAAAVEAARVGVQVTLIDENPVSTSMVGLNVPQFFGQRFTGALPKKTVSKAVMMTRVAAANEALAQAEEAGVDVQLGTCVWGAFRNTETSRLLDGPSDRPSRPQAVVDDEVRPAHRGSRLPATWASDSQVGT